MCSGYVNNWVKQQQQQENPAENIIHPEDDSSNEHDNTFESLGDETFTATARESTVLNSTIN